MLTETARAITLAQRPWATPPKLQSFLGTYVLESRSGIFFAQRTPEVKARRIAHTFLKLPRLLQELCRNYQVTISTGWGLTENGNSSTLYADFKQSSKEKISPHIEIGARSMQTRMLLPHLAHETAHILWRSLPAEARRDYTGFLVGSCGPGTVEVTEYVDSFFRDWRRSLEIPDEESYAENHRQSYLELWAEESFCDTVAKLVAPRYPSYRQDSTVDLRQRRRRIRGLTGLQIA